MTVCRSCQAPIRWVRTAAGKAMPLDVSPSSEGNVQIGLIGGIEVAIVLASPSDRAVCVTDGIPLYVTHFATCPNAAQHRMSR